MDMLNRLAGLAGIVLMSAMGLAHARPNCHEDTFSGERGCVYGRGSIGLPGIGNQILTKDGKMVFQRAIMRIGGNPVQIEAVLFRVDDRRTIRLPATNADQPRVNCSGRLCTWSWSVIAPLSADVLAELASAKKLVIGFRGEGQTIEESELKRGGQIFAKFLDDIRANEPSVLETADGEAFLMEGANLVPYTPPGA